MTSKAEEDQPIIIDAKQRGPGPAKYGLPVTVGHKDHDPTRHRHPAYSFGTRTLIKETERSPGPIYSVPKHVTVRGRDDAPSFSLTGKPKDQEAFMSPAPGTYRPEGCPIPHNTNAPKYTFGLRMKPWKEDSSPAPNSYVLPNLTGPRCPVKASAAAYSMKSRPLTGAYWEDLTKTPGPGTYDASDLNTVNRKYPAYSIKGRNYGVKEGNMNPGPGTYDPDCRGKKGAPAYTFGIRHTEYKTMLLDE